MQIKLKRVALGTAILVIGFAAYVVVDGLTSRPQSADVAIVFGNMIERSGVPSARLKARLETARQLYTSGTVSAIIVSGGIGKEGFDESSVMKSYLVGKGVPENSIYADAQGNNTAQTCGNAGRIMAAQGWRRANVVSQFFHISRAKLSCRRAGIDVVGAAAPRYFEIRDLYSLAREIIAFPTYWIRDFKSKSGIMS